MDDYHIPTPAPEATPEELLKARAEFNYPEFIRKQEEEKKRRVIQEAREAAQLEADYQAALLVLKDKSTTAPDGLMYMDKPKKKRKDENAEGQ